MFRTKACYLYRRALSVPCAVSKISYDQKNVVYIAYVGQYNSKHVFKYGKSTNIYQREATHKKTFEYFDLMYIHETDMKDQVEQIFEKELMSQDLHTSMVICDKKQTELFQLETKEHVEEVNALLTKIVEEADGKRADAQKIQLATLSLRKLEIKYQTKLLEYKIKLLEHNMCEYNK